MSPEIIKRAGKAMFEAGATHALGPEIYEEQASWWEECAQAAFATIPWIEDAGRLQDHNETVERVARIIAYRDLSSVFVGSLLARAVEVRWSEYKDDAHSVIMEIAAVLRLGDLA